MRMSCENRARSMFVLKARQAWRSSADGVMTDAETRRPGVSPEEIRVPVTLRHGTKDLTSRLGWRRRRPAAQLQFHLIDGAGHYSLPIRHIREILTDLRTHLFRAPSLGMAERSSWKTTPARRTISLRGVNRRSARRSTRVHELVADWGVKKFELIGGTDHHRAEDGARQDGDRRPADEPLFRDAICVEGALPVSAVSQSLRVRFGARCPERSA